jgi:hypothetical protein
MSNSDKIKSDVKCYLPFPFQQLKPYLSLMHDNTKVNISAKIAGIIWFKVYKQSYINTSKFKKYINDEL